MENWNSMLCAKRKYIDQKSGPGDAKLLELLSA